MKTIAIDRAALLESLQALIRIDSVNPSLVPGGRGEGAIAAYLGQYLEASGLEVRTREIAPGRVNVVGILKGSGGGRSIILNGHTDTVGLDKMTIDPLDPVLRDGRVYGRGSLDMKGGLAAAIAAVRAIAAGDRLRGDIILACVADEEYASIGTEALIEEYTADAAIVCEPSALGLGIAHKGFAWATIDVHGLAAHGSKPELGIDAIVKAGKFLVALEALGEKLAARAHPLLGPASVHASLIEGGSELSTYPDHCRIKIERRTLPGEDRETVAAELAALVAGLAASDKQFKADWDIFFHRHPFETAPDAPIAAAVSRAGELVLGAAPRPMGFSGWLDSALLAAAGIPTVIFGPAGEGLHAASEHVEFQSVADTAAILAAAVEDFCR
jgi:acetylornithine deacetylase